MISGIVMGVLLCAAFLTLLFMPKGNTDRELVNGCLLILLSLVLVVVATFIYVASVNECQHERILVNDRWYLSEDCLSEGE